MSAAQGMLAKLGIDTQTPVRYPFDFMSCTLDLAEVIKDGNGLRGTLSHAKERVRSGNKPCNGQIVMEPNAVELSRLLQAIMGGSPTGSGTVTYPLSDAAPSPLYVVEDLIAKVQTTSGVVIDKATFRGDQGEPLKLTLDCVGVDQTEGNAGTFPNLTLDTATGPWMFADLSFSLNSGTVQAKNFELEIDHMIDKDRFFNSQSLVSAVRTDRKVTLKTLLPYGDAYALLSAGAPPGIAAVATFTNGGAVLAFSMASLIYPSNVPHVEGRKEIMLQIDGQAYKSGTTLELVTTLNVGP